MALHFLNGLFNKKEGSALGIDIGSSSIKVVQISKRGSQAVLDTYGELSLGPYGNVGVGKAVRLSTDKVSEALTALLTEKEVNITARAAGIAVPFESSLMTTFTLPLVQGKQLETAIPLEARKYIPVPISEVTLDWSIIPPNEVEDGEAVKQSGTEILLVAIHNDILAAYQQIAEKTKLEVKFFEIEIFSTLRAVASDETAPVLIIDMGATNTKVYILERGVVRASHTVNYGSQDITQSIAMGLGIDFIQAEVIKRDTGLNTTQSGTNIAQIAEVPLNRIFSQANRILFNFEKKYNKTIKQALLVGGGSSLKGVDAFATNILKTETLMANPFQKIETPAFIDEVLAQTGPEFVVAIGLALRCLREIE